MFEKLKRAHDIFKATKHKLTEANDNLTHAFEWAQKQGRIFEETIAKKHRDWSDSVLEATSREDLERLCMNAHTVIASTKEPLENALRNLSYYYDKYRKEGGHYRKDVDQLLDARSSVDNGISIIHDNTTYDSHINGECYRTFKRELKLLEKALDLTQPS